MRAVYVAASLLALVPIATVIYFVGFQDSRATTLVVDATATSSSRPKAGSPPPAPHPLAREVLVVEYPEEEALSLEIDYSGVPRLVGLALRELADGCGGDGPEALQLLLEGLAQYEGHPELETALVTYSHELFHALWSRHPYLREQTRDLFNRSESPYLQRVLLQAMILDSNDLDGYFSELEYDILDAAMSTTDPLLLVDCVGNICNRRNAEITRAALDFALGLDPDQYGFSQHPGIDGVLNSYLALTQIHPNDTTVQAQMRQDLEWVATSDEVNLYQFLRALDLLRSGKSNDLLNSIVAHGTRSLDPDIAAYCRSRAGSKH